VPETKVWETPEAVSKISIEDAIMQRGEEFSLVALPVRVILA
jgi:hypothetical protein